METYIIYTIIIYIIYKLLIGRFVESFEGCSIKRMELADNHMPLFLPKQYTYGRSNIGTVKDIDNNQNTLFTAHPINLACSTDQNEWTKHVRINDSGGMMYASNREPTESNDCKETVCPDSVQDLWTVGKKSHFDPYPLRKDKLKCWTCFQ
jgi:hypothetical protein